MTPTAPMTDEALAILVAVKQARMATLGPFEVARAERLILEAPGREQYRRRLDLDRSIEAEAEQLLARHTFPAAPLHVVRDELENALRAMPADATESEIVYQASRGIRRRTEAPGGRHHLARP